MLRRLALLLIAATLLSAGLFHTTSAATPNIEKGLLITPLRQFLSVDAGNTLHSSFSVANLTDGPLTVDLKVQQFSVSDYVYDYTFSKPDNPWLQLSATSINLEAHKTKSIAYSIAVPTNTSPGGHYYTLLASATLSSGSIKNTLQAADLVYLTVNGKLTTVSHLESSSIRQVNFGHDIPFTLQPVNTGNVYSFVYVSGELRGLFTRPPQTSDAHLLMPGHVRTLSDSIPSPVLPGVYRAVYGYRTDTDWIIQQSRWIVYIPPWFIALLLGLVLILPRVLPRLRRKKSTPTDSKD
jgi:hypothetical protein